MEVNVIDKVPTSTLLGRANVATLKAYLKDRVYAKAASLIKKRIPIDETEEEQITVLSLKIHVMSNHDFERLQALTSDMWNNAMERGDSNVAYQIGTIREFLTKIPDNGKEAVHNELPEV